MRAIRWFRAGVVVLLALLIALLAGVVWLWIQYPSVDPAAWFLLASVLVALWLAVVAVFVVTFAFRLRHTLRTWLSDTVARYPDAFLEAQPVMAQPLPSLAEAPVTVLWRFTPGARWTLAATFSLGLVDIVAQLGTAPGNLQGIPPFSTLINALSTPNPVLHVGIAVGVAFIIALLVQAWLARPFGVILSDAGIEMRSTFQRRRFLRWDEARQLDYLANRGRYVLRGERRVVSWPRLAPKNARPLNVPAEEVVSPLKLVLALTEERTGLHPRVTVG